MDDFEDDDDDDSDLDDLDLSGDLGLGGVASSDDDAGDGDGDLTLSEELAELVSLGKAGTSRTKPPALKTPRRDHADRLAALDFQPSAAPGRADSSSEGIGQCQWSGGQCISIAMC